MLMRHCCFSAVSLFVLASFSQAIEPDKLFPPDAVVNVTLPPYTAKPDDGLDDTAAIQKAISDNVDTGRTLYFPAGVYDLSDTLVWKNHAGLWRPHLTLQGQHRSKTIFRLKDSAPGFDDPKKPKAIIMTGSFWQPGDNEDGGGNKAFRNNLFDLLVDAGDGNSGAIGIEWAVSNVGSIENCTIGSFSIFSGKTPARTGISMRRGIPGPGFMKRVTVGGFDTNIEIGDMQYGVTAETLLTLNDSTTGIRLGDNLLHMQGSSVSRMQITGRNGVVTAIGTSFSDGHTPEGHVISSEGTLMLRRARTDDPKLTIRDRDRTLNATQAANVPPLSGADESLVVAAYTPIYWNPTLTDWTPIGPRLATESDDTQAMQRAIDAGKSTVYFPNTRAYFISDTVILRGKTKQILGMGSEISLGGAKEPFSNTANPRPLIRIDETDHKSDVFIENVFFNAQYPGEVIFENNSPATLVIRHCGGWVGANGFRRSYQNTPKSFGGKVFIEDCFLPGWRFEKQKVWARQFNPENPDGDGKTPQVENIGGDLWILGFKTEGPAPFITTRDGARTELLGAYNYISATAAPKVPTDAVPYIVKDATAHLTFTTDNFRPDSDYAVYVRSIQGDVVKDWRPDDLPPRNGNPGDRSHAVPFLRVAPPDAKP